METLPQFRERTERFIFTSLPPAGCMETSGGLRDKVGEDGRMKPFEGNTVIYELPETVRERIARIQERLYAEAKEVLGERIIPESFHITLHDLESGPPSPMLEEAVLRTEQRARLCAEQLAGSQAPIRIRSTVLFNMVNTSMVLGFEPEEEEDCRILMEGYERFQEIIPLSYALTPHVTVAYFRPGIIFPHQIDGLRRAAEWVNKEEPIRAELTGDMLRYRRFRHMNCYF